jgi:hypothetical protein
MRITRLKPYCLRCYAPLPEDADRCRACGHLVSFNTRLQYWTREPLLVGVEIGLKVAIFVLTIVAVIVILASFERLGGWMAGWNLAVPVFIAFPLWMTASCLTARGGFFNPVWFWCAAWVLMGLFLVAFSLWLAVVPITLVIITVTAGMEFRRWKVRRVLNRQARLAGE